MRMTNLQEDRLKSNAGESVAMETKTRLYQAEPGCTRL